MTFETRAPSGENVGRGLVSSLGLLLGALAFTASLTPSLIPRTGLAQGALAGLAFAVAYGLGAAAAGLWKALGLWTPKLRSNWITRSLGPELAALIVLYGLVNATAWQNFIRATMAIPPVESARPFTIAATGAAVAAILILLGHLFGRLARYAAAILAPVVPPRVARIAGVLVAAALFWTIGNGLLLRMALQALDSSYRQVDHYIPPEAQAPADPEKTGSAASLVSWECLGRQGRNRVLAAPTRADIAEITGEAAKEPLRVYVGSNCADTAAERADLALSELIRVGGFDRAALVIATPTGTGWVDPAGMAPVEILHRGDIASVSVQYSYLPSWLSLLVQPEYGEETARAVFASVYGHWRSLPRDKRPRLYLFGLSLGAFNSDLSADLFDIIGDPYDGALWVGPPFASRTWRDVTARRAPGSPAWLPIFRDSSLIRFENQTSAPVAPGATWGRMRIVYLQYASDPITFFELSSWRRRPAWMEKPRGPDVSPGFRWRPVVTFLQLLFDVVLATTTPKGVGHVYAAEHYLNGWMAVTAPEGWTPDRLDAMRKWFVAQGL